MLKKSILLFVISILLFSNCSEDSYSEEAEKEEFDPIISFDEWLYRSGNPSILKCHITADDYVVLEAIMTMYDDSDKLLGINEVTIGLKADKNIGYFVIDTNISNVITKIELRDFHINGKKYSITKTFNVQLEE